MKLQNLVTLCTNVWPNTNLAVYETPTSISAERYYEHQLQRLAQHIFSRSDRDAQGKLNVVAFGPPHLSLFTNDDEDLKIEQIRFMRGKLVDPFGQTSSMAVMAPLWKLRYEEPEVQVLGFGLEIGINMYI